VRTSAHKIRQRKSRMILRQTLGDQTPQGPTAKAAYGPVTQWAPGTRSEIPPLDLVQSAGKRVCAPA